MHDIKGLEELGVVSIGIATTEFIDAADIQNKYLSYDPAVAYVDHPIQDRTAAEIIALADGIFDHIVSAVSGEH